MHCCPSTDLVLYHSNENITVSDWVRSTPRQQRIVKIDRFNRSRVLTSDELDQVHDQLSEPHRVLATLLRKTAARVSEGLALRWKHVTPTSIIYIRPTTKGKRQTRSVPLDPTLAEELSAWKQLVNPTDDPDAWVFPGRNPGEHLTRRGFDHALRKACEVLDLRGFSTHGFRRSILTSAYQAGVPLRNLQSISEHASLNQISVYLEVPEQAKTDAVMLSA